MTEAEVVSAFVAWLVSKGWSVRTEVDHVDILAERDGLTLLAEAKGQTGSTGLDVDTAYGQLLRRIRPGIEELRYALVVPASARRAAERVRPQIRAVLKIELYTVAENSATKLV